MLQRFRDRESIQAACLFVRSKYIKKGMGIFKSLSIVNLYQVMSVLKLKINVNPRLEKNWNSSLPFGQVTLKFLKVINDS